MFRRSKIANFVGLGLNLKHGAELHLRPAHPAARKYLRLDFEIAQGDRHAARVMVLGFERGGGVAEFDHAHKFVIE